MKNQSLTAERLKEVLSYDQATGAFRWRNEQRKGMKSLIGAGGVSNKGYIRVGIDGVRYLAHRLAWLYVYGEFPSQQIDHINGIRTDNRIKNLRCTTHQGNTQNLRRAQRNNRCGLLGVSIHPCGKWVAWITVDKRGKYLGLFDTKELAHRAYVEAKRKLHPTGTL